jgi:hypothetical protein
MFNYSYRLEHIFSFGAALESPPEAIGPVAEGIRVNFYCQGGEVKAQNCRGGADPSGVTGSRFARTGWRFLMSAPRLKAKTGR